jgi:hypothetical protein
MGPRTVVLPCLIALASAAGSIAHAASVNYNSDGLPSDNVGTLAPSGTSEFGVFDVDKLFQRPSSRPFLFEVPLSPPLQFPDFNSGKNDGGGLSDTDLFGLFGPNDHFTITTLKSGNASNISTSNSTAITSSDQVTTNSITSESTSAPNSTGVSVPLRARTSSASSLPLLLLNSIAPSTASAPSPGSATSTPGAVSAAPLPDALSLSPRGWAV